MTFFLIRTNNQFMYDPHLHIIAKHSSCTQLFQGATTLYAVVLLYVPNGIRAVGLNNDTRLLGQ